MQKWIAIWMCIWSFAVLGATSPFPPNKPLQLVRDINKIVMTLFYGNSSVNDDKRCLAISHKIVLIFNCNANTFGNGIKKENKGKIPVFELAQGVVLAFHRYASVS